MVAGARCRLAPCGSRSTGSRASATSRPCSPTRPRASRRSSIRVATSTSTSTRPRPGGLRITHVVETHLHNDYVSGGRELASLTGATHVIGAGAELRYEHVPLRDGDTFDVGALRFDVLDTPGHTPEHVSYAVADTCAGRRAAAPPDRRLAPRRRGRPDRSPGRGERHPVRPRDVPLAPRGAAAARGLRGGLPDPRRGVAVLDRDRVDAVDHDRLRAPARPAAGAASTSMRSPGRCSAGSRRSRATSRGCARSTRPARRSSAGVVPELAALPVDARGGRDRCRGRRGRPATGRRSTRPGTCPARCPSRPARRSGRGSAGSWTPTARSSSSSTARDALDDLARQALRIGYDAVVGYLARRVRRLVADGRPAEAGGRLSIDELATALGGDPADAPARHRRPPGHRSTRPVTCRARATSTAGRCPTAWPSCRATARSRRSARPATGLGRRLAPARGRVRGRRVGRPGRGRLGCRRLPTEHGPADAAGTRRRRWRRRPGARPHHTAPPLRAQDFRTGPRMVLVVQRHDG